VVNAGGVAVDGGGGLSAKVAIAGIEIERADVVRAASAGKLHATLNPRDGVMPLHNSSVVFCGVKDRHGGGAAKVTMGRWVVGVPLWELALWRCRQDMDASETRELLRRKERDPSARFARSGQAASRGSLRSIVGQKAPSSG
jgi:hypothetical protein